MLLYFYSYGASILEITSFIFASSFLHPNILPYSYYIFANLSNKYLDMPRGFLNVCNVSVLQCEVVGQIMTVFVRFLCQLKFIIC